MKKEYLKNDNQILNEIFRRLGYFQCWQLNYSKSLIILTPSEAKRLVSKGILKPNSKEVERVSNWYYLDKKGIDLFKPITQNRNKKISPLLNEKMFNGFQLIDFNKLNIKGNEKQI
jgi:hypothetical protein